MKNKIKISYFAFNYKQESITRTPGGLGFSNDKLFSFFTFTPPSSGRHDHDHSTSQKRHSYSPRSAPRST